MSRRVSIFASLVFALLIVGLPGRTQEALPEPATAESTRLLLDTVRTHLVELRFEEALASIEALLGQPGTTPADRGEALVLRSQAHVALGDLKAAEEDYGQILRMRPGYRPDSSLTPRKAMTRFDKVRAALIGELLPLIDPPGATLSVDGQEVVSIPGEPLPLLAGEHVIEATHVGFDAARASVQVEAGAQVPLELQLVPNARTVVIRTEPEGVEVVLDGLPVGRTERVRAATAAELTIEHLPLGEHVFELSMPCFRTERREELLTVDLLDRAPRILPVTRMVPVRSSLVPVGGPTGATVIVDGRPEAALPSSPIELCPGSYLLEVRLADRTVWRSEERLTEGEERVVEVRPRPNVTILGAAEWPAELRELSSRFNVVRGARPARAADLTTPGGWARIELPTDTDLAVARLPASRRRPPGWVLFSPILEIVLPVERPIELRRPQWSGSFWGLTLADSEAGGTALVVDVAEAGPAAEVDLRPGDRLVALGGVELRSAAQARGILGVASVAAPIDLSWVDRDGRKRTGALRGRPSPRILDRPEDDVTAVVQAAWAAVDAAADPERSDIARANVAFLQSSFGLHERAAESWRRVKLPDRAGVGQGTVQYYLGRTLERLGREGEATKALRAAAASRSTVFRDDGTPVAPAARDRLTDLGVSSEAR